MKKDVLALGELLIDFTEYGVSDQENPVFEANPGGAPCNVLAMLTKLGRKTAFIGKVGDDAFGHTLKNEIENLGIDASQVFFDKEIPTTLAFVHIFEGGEREFSFYRNPGADLRLQWEEIDSEILRKYRVFHFGTLSMTDKSMEEVTKKALAVARESGAWISFDPNLRLPLWKSKEAAKEKMRYGMANCQILKISDYELEFVTGEKDLDKAIELLRKEYELPLILLTLGKDGSKAYYQDLVVSQKAFLQKNTVDTTGAGDTFFGCCLHFVLEYGLYNLTKENLEEMLRFAAAGASLITRKKGALKVMPKEQEIREMLASKKE